MSRRRALKQGRDQSPPDPGHGCADPPRCTQPFCAAPVQVHLVAPQDTRVVVRDLPGWSPSASALLDRLNEQITREQLLNIADCDPFGAHLHFPILVRIRLSGRVPPQLGFNPGEVLRLTRWGKGPDVDHLGRAWCCALMVIASGDTSDEFCEVGAQLVQSCLALGADVPEQAERLLAWRAVSEEPDVARQLGVDRGCLDHMALLALLLLQAATDPADARLAGLLRTVADAFDAPEKLPWPWSDDLPLLMRSVSAPHWRHLIDTILTPLRPTQPDVDRLAAALGRTQRATRNRVRYGQSQ